MAEITSADVCYTYKAGDVIRFRDTPNTRIYRDGASIGKTHVLLEKEIEDINRVENGICALWTTYTNLYGTNFKKGDVELLVKTTENVPTAFQITSTPVNAPVDISYDLGAHQSGSWLEGSHQVKIFGIHPKPSDSDIVYITKSKNKRNLLTF